MNYKLMHKNIVVMEMEINEAAVAVVDIGTVYAEEHVPLGVFGHFLRCLDFLGIGGIRTAIDKMLTLDYIIANEDRHFNNFGFVRNADTLEWLELAPIFDCGTSLWQNALDTNAKRKCQPFCEDQEEQLKLVSDLSWFKLEALKGIE